MRIASVLIGVIAGGLVAAPAFATTNAPQKADDKPGSSTCRAYQKAADGSWTELACQETGKHQTQHKSVTKDDRDPR